MAARSTARIRLLQFVEALISAAEAYHSLRPMTKRMVDEKCPALGHYLRTMSDGLAQGVCDALEDERRKSERRR
jgi:hypothetical protein